MAVRHKDGNTYNVGTCVKWLSLTVVFVLIGRDVLELNGGIGPRGDGGSELVQLVALVTRVDFGNVTHNLRLKVGLSLGV